MKIAICSTTSKTRYDEYARKNYELIKENWPSDVELHVYTEDKLTPTVNGVTYHKFFKYAPKWREFLERHKDTKYVSPIRHGKSGIKPYKEDLLKWGWKVFAQWAAAKNIDCDILIYLDSDVITFNKLPIDKILKYYNQDKFVAYTNREKNRRNIDMRKSKWLSTETGIMIYNMRHPYAQEFFDRYVDFYNSDRILTENECTDNYLLDVLIAEMEKEGKIANIKMCDGTPNDPLTEIDLGQYLRHTMGKIKGKKQEQLLKDTETQDLPKV